MSILVLLGIAYSNISSEVSNLSYFETCELEDLEKQRLKLVNSRNRLQKLIAMNRLLVMTENADFKVVKVFLNLQILNRAYARIDIENKETID